MTDEEKRQIIRESVQLMVKFHIEHRQYILERITTEYVDKWLDKQEKEKDGV